MIKSISLINITQPTTITKIPKIKYNPLVPFLPKYFIKKDAFTELKKQSQLKIEDSKEKIPINTKIIESNISIVNILELA